GPVRRLARGGGVGPGGGGGFAAPAVVCNADPGVALALLDRAADPQWAEQVRAVPMEGITVKVNMTLSELPNFTARPGTREPHHTGQVNTPLSKDEWRTAHRLANQGELPPRLWAELYLQTVYDDT